jgi:hypothetical protein
MQAGIQQPPHVKPVVGATTTVLGTYWLYDAIKTAVDLYGEPQQNREKGTILNVVIAAGLIAIGSYMLKQLVSDEKK